MSLYVFGYGSLMNSGSAERLLGRSLAPGELRPAWLEGYVRTWSLKERVLSETLGREVTAVFLDLTAEAASRCNGVLLEVSEGEMARVRQREKNYDALDVTDRTVQVDSNRPLEGSVVTFVARRLFRTGEQEDEAWVMQRYVDMLHTACTALGTQFQHAFAASTRPHPYPVLGGRYTFIDPVQAKLV